MSLKELTAEAHRAAETSPFVKLIFSGNIAKEDYVRYLVNQELIYLTLESFADSHGLFDDLPGIKRSKKIREDILELEIDTFRDPEPSTNDYLEHLKTIKDDPKKLLAHVYVRHMGDLFGGQMIATRVPGSGNYYKFDDPDTLKSQLRLKLDDSLSDEALVCFGFATKLFEDLMK